MTVHTCPIPKCGAQVPGRLCDDHHARVVAALAKLPRHYVDLSLAMTPGSTMASDRVKISKTPPMPIDATARSLQNDMLGLVNSAERAHRTASGYSRQPRRGREGRQLVGAVLYLRAHLDTLLALEWGGAFAFELLALVGAIRAALGLVTLVHKLPAPCPTCDMLALERRDGAGLVVCRYCGRKFTEDDYARLVLILAGDVRESGAA